jgi:uncharacterized protein DUF1501
MHTDAFNHQPADTLLMTGHQLVGRPTVGSWVLYGLGSESRDLPGFVVLSTGKNNMAQGAQWSSGFLASAYQGVMFRRKGDPVLYLSNPDGTSREEQRLDFDLVAQLNRERAAASGDPEIASRIASYEMAFRMQASTPDLLDLSKETASVREMYGLEKEQTRAYGTNCLLARRLVERGVRFVLVSHSSWDQHQTLNKDLKQNCDITAGPVAALIQDLKQRGMLDSTLVVWGGEFGRTVYSQGKLTNDNYGRDHHPRNFCMWLAGGGIKGGISHGETDDFSYNVVENPVHINDFNATILHCLGIDHERFTVKFQGLEQRLSGVESPKVVKELLA